MDLDHRNDKRLLLCGATVGVPRCRNFVVYLADKDYPSVLHMVIRRALTYTFLQIFFCVNEIENVERIVGSSHVCPQNQNNAITCPNLYTRAKKRHRIIP